jgi:hypothetical protein
MSKCADCGRSPCAGRGLCKSCYYKRYRRGTLPPKIPGGYRERMVLACTIPGCPGKHEALGYCGKHYQRLTKVGSLDDPRATLEDSGRFWAQTKRAEDGSGCLLWTSTIRDTGYGQVWWEGKSEIAHRIAYLLATGPVPPRHSVDHVQANGCRHAECVEPAHLEAVTHAVNQQRKMFTTEQLARFAAGGRKGSETRWRGTGTPEERFWKKGEPAGDGSGCLLWTGYVNRKTGYGNVSWQGKTKLVHRVAYALANARPVPDGYDVDHVRERGCRYKHCIEPAHLEAVPAKLNRGRRAHPAVPREVMPERPDGPGRRRRSSAVQGGVTKTDPAVVAEWKAQLAAGKSQTALAREVGVSQATISRAVRDSR